MIPRIVRFVLRMPAFVIILALGLVALGLYCYQQLDIEAYPNPVAPMIEIITQPGGWSAEEVERYVTIPLENGLNGMIDLDHRAGCAHDPGRGRGEGRDVAARD